MRAPALLALLSAPLVELAEARPSKPCKPAPGDWATYNHDLAATRYSTLTQIAPANVARLTQAWTYSML